MLLISDEYRELNRIYHEQRPDYGVKGQIHAQNVAGLAASLGVRELLDYGAGKCTLAQSLPQFIVHNYDPCIPELSADPEPHDLVVCTDVLEHVEENCVEAVLDHLKEKVRKSLYLQVATAPAIKTLPDGRNTHITIWSYRCWLPLLLERWELFTFSNNPDGKGGFSAFMAMLGAKV